MEHQIKDESWIQHSSSVETMESYNGSLLVHATHNNVRGFWVTSCLKGSCKKTKWFPGTSDENYRAALEYAQSYNHDT